jgi:SHS2 domain-containing protein
MIPSPTKPTFSGIPSTFGGELLTHVHRLVLEDGLVFVHRLPSLGMILIRKNPSFSRRDQGPVLATGQVRVSVRHRVRMSATRRTTDGADRFDTIVTFRDTMIEMLDHTADVGFGLRAPMLEELFDELTYLVQDVGFVPVSAEIQIRRSAGTALSVEASLAGAPLLLEEYGWQGEIKSATFHGLDIANDDESWHARVILDV